MSGMKTCHVNIDVQFIGSWFRYFAQRFTASVVVEITVTYKCKVTLHPFRLRRTWALDLNILFLLMKVLVKHLVVVDVRVREITRSPRKTGTNIWECRKTQPKRNFRRSIRTKEICLQFEGNQNILRVLVTCMHSRVLLCFGQFSLWMSYE